MEKQWLQKNTKLKLLYYWSRYLTPVNRKLLCNAIIQPHFDYRCYCFTPLQKYLKLELQKAWNKCICFYLNLLPESHIDPSHFRKINWLLVSNTVYCTANTAFKHWNGIVLAYIYDMFKPSLCKYSARSLIALDIPLEKTNTGQKSLSFLGPKIWSKIDPSTKNFKTLSSFMYAFKKIFLLHMQRHFK